MKFEKLIKVIEEGIVPDAKGYYIDVFGNITYAPTSHYEQIIDDYDLEPEMNSEFESMFGEPLNLNNDHDVDWTNEFVSEFMVNSKIFAIVYDIKNKIVYVRASQKDLNEKQRESIVNFCIKNNSELEYDTMKYQ